MLRIVGIQRNESPNQEFVLLQNRGSMRVNLRGHALVAEGALSGAGGPAIVISDDVDLYPGQYAMIRSGIGPARWNKSTDGSQVFCGYLGCAYPLWEEKVTVHLLSVQHSFVERGNTPALA